MTIHVGLAGRIILPPQHPRVGHGGENLPDPLDDLAMLILQQAEHVFAWRLTVTTPSS